ncbi:MAG: hypothetical protein E7582_01515 [Ruminococcaceae bacterium]|nr:hypothetical protein [Oscillospiraceae bacterium]
MNYNFLIPKAELSCDKRNLALIKLLKLKDNVYTLNSAEEMLGIENPIVILPFFIQDEVAASFLKNLDDGSQVFGGHEGEICRSIINSKNLSYVNILNEEQFCKENALITAEATLALIINATDTTLYSMRVAVFGYGRIGQRLTRMLLSLGATVRVFSSSDEELTRAKTQGISACHLWQRESMDIFHTVVNTIPLRHVINQETLSQLNENVYILDLASGENNVDWKAMNTFTLHGERAGSLPAKVSPKSAALAVKNAIFRHLN